MEKIRNSKFLNVIYRIKCLLNMMIGDKLRKLDKKGKQKRAFKIFLSCLLVIALFVGIYFLLSFLKTYTNFTFDSKVLSAIILLSQVVSIIFSIPTIENVLFKDKENSMLLTFPVTYTEIAFSKLLLFYLQEVKKNVFFLFPFLLAYGAINSVKFTYYIAAIFLYFILCAIPIFIASAFSVILIYVLSIVRSNNIIAALFRIGIFLLILFLARDLIIRLPRPLRIIAKFNDYLNSTLAFVRKIGDYSFFYKGFTGLLYGDNTFINLLIVLGAFIGSIAIGLLVIMPFYFNTVGKSSERSEKKLIRINKRKREYSSLIKKKDSKHIYFTFLKKELILTFRDIDRLMSLITGVFALPMVLFLLNKIIDRINTNSFGDILMVSFNLLIGICLLSGFNSDSSSALSREGLEFQILKTAPTNTMSVAWAKITTALTINLLSIIASTVMLKFSTNINVLSLIYMAIILFIISSALVLWNFELDVKKPMIHDYATKGSGVVNNHNTNTAILIGFIVSLITLVLSLLLQYDDKPIRGFFMGTGWVRIFLISIAFLAARLYLFRKNLFVYFKDIEL